MNPTNLYVIAIPLMVLLPFSTVGQAFSAPITTAVLGEQFQLKLNQTVSIESENIMVRFVKVVEDSRCPADVVCVWEGQVKILVDVNRDQDHTNSFNLTSRAGESFNIEVFDGYSMSLLKVEPYPESSKTIEPSEYIATLTVTKAGSDRLNSDRVYVRALIDRNLGENPFVIGHAARLVAAWNVKEAMGIILIMPYEDNGISARTILRFTPTITTCSGADASECIDGLLTYSNSDRLSEGSKIRLEINKQMSTMLLEQVDNENAENKISFLVDRMKTRSEVILQEGQREGPLLIQTVYPEHIEGLNFIEYPLSMDKGLPLTLRIGESASNGCTVMLTLLEINDTTARFLKTEDTGKPCPICHHNIK